MVTCVTAAQRMGKEIGWLGVRAKSVTGNTVYYGHTYL